MYLEKEAKIIADYINEPRYTQAVLINGEWGVGKTFFVNNILLNELTDYIVIRYSLYGVQSSKQIMTDLQREMIIKLIGNKKFNIKEKKIKIPEKIVDIAPDTIDIFLKRIGLEADNLKDLIKKIDFDKSRIIIVFDDLERAGIEINEVLGLINSYVECHGIKVIIIANEKEIGSSRISADLPQKFMVAANTSISLNEIDPIHNNGQNNKSSENNYNYSELVNRTKTLFSNDIIYNTIKEKLIGLTVTLHANYHQLYDKIVLIYGHESSAFLLKNKDAFIELFQDLDCQNLRTLIFAVITFDKIYEAIDPLKSKYNKQDSSNLFNEELLCIMKSVAFFSIQYKSGQNIHTNNNVFSAPNYYGVKGIKEYHFVNKYICLHELDIESIRNGLSTYIESEIEKQKTKEEKESLAYYKLTSFGWLDYNDNDVIKLSDQLYDELSAGIYSVAFFKYIIVYLIQLEYHFNKKRAEIKHTDDEYIELMVDYIKNNEPIENQLESLDLISDEKEFLNKYNSFVSPLIKATKEKEVASTNMDFKNILDSEEWAEQFYKYCRDNYNNFMDSRRFLSSFDMDLIKKKLLKASNKDIQRFSQAICSVYDFGNIRDFYNSDSSYLEIIIAVLDEIYNDTKTNCTTKVVIDTYKGKLENKLKFLK
ncbi:P-loop NTPase fold protein [Ruminococcus flavefaciens]|uniref:P-loop NTPase fold protein n=1 Tax=Ruminococcus flavefaciens TaxID=1265 RepID=UPI0026ED7DFB|nr:P-loop NTPase fold protein [Ruminococcus flavefaciens]